MKKKEADKDYSSLATKMMDGLLERSPLLIITDDKSWQCSTQLNMPTTLTFWFSGSQRLQLFGQIIFFFYNVSNSDQLQKQAWQINIFYRLWQRNLDHSRWIITYTWSSDGVPLAVVDESHRSVLPKIALHPRWSAATCFLSASQIRYILHVFQLSPPSLS